MSPNTSSLTLDAPNGTIDSLEAEVQQLLDYVAQASPEARSVFLSRVFQALVVKSTPTFSTDLFKGAKAQTPKPTTATPQPIRDKKPLPWTGLGRVTLSDPYDPIEGWNHFGHDTYWRILYYEMLPNLERILAHPNMPPGPKLTKKTMTSNTALAKAIIERLEQHFNHHP